MDVIKKKTDQETVVGKNSISIPSLNIPNINEKKVIFEEEEVKQVEIPDIMNKQAVI